MDGEDAAAPSLKKPAGRKARLYGRSKAHRYGLAISSALSARALEVNWADVSQFGDFDAEFVRAALDILPFDAISKLRFELVAKRDRIVVVEENKVVTHV